MAEKKTASAAEKDESVERTNVIKIFGEELELTRPMGVAGLKFLPKAHTAFKKMLELMGPVEALIKSSDQNSLILSAEMLGLVTDILVTDDFIDEVLPGFFIYSTKKYTKAQALDKINSSEITTATTMEIFDAFVTAINFWSAPSDPDALEAALKK